jgi:hypothetical protein
MVGQFGLRESGGKRSQRSNVDDAKSAMIALHLRAEVHTTPSAQKKVRGA